MCVCVRQPPAHSNTSLLTSDTTYDQQQEGCRSTQPDDLTVQTMPPAQPFLCMEIRQPKTRWDYLKQVAKREKQQPTAYKTKIEGRNKRRKTAANHLQNPQRRSKQEAENSSRPPTKVIETVETSEKHSRQPTDPTAPTCSCLTTTPSSDISSAATAAACSCTPRCHASLSAAAATCAAAAAAAAWGSACSCRRSCSATAQASSRAWPLSLVRIAIVLYSCSVMAVAWEAWRCRWVTEACVRVAGSQGHRVTGCTIQGCQCWGVKAGEL